MKSCGCFCLSVRNDPGIVLKSSPSMWHGIEKVDERLLWVSVCRLPEYCAGWMSGPRMFCYAAKEGQVPDVWNWSCHLPRRAACLSLASLMMSIFGVGVDGSMFCLTVFRRWIAVDDAEGRSSTKHASRHLGLGVSEVQCTGTIPPFSPHLFTSFTFTGSLHSGYRHVVKGGVISMHRTAFNPILD